MFAVLRQSAERFRELAAALEDPALHGDPQKLAAVAREMGSLRAKAEVYQRYETLQEQRDAATEALDDPDLRELATEELAEVEAELGRMVADMRRQVADDDPHKGRNVMIEIRAGTGGDEASLFAGELARIYTRFAESQGLTVELLVNQPSEVGGCKECVLEVRGERAWELLRYESGGHRVQRVPATESQGRIHTSAATVAVMPQAEEVDFAIDEADLRIDTFRSSGPGGQSVNKTSSAIRIVHVPTNTVVQCQDEKSQHKNKAAALKMLRTRLLDVQLRARKSEQDAARRSLIGSGDRSERIRTYNWPQNRVTDHRIKKNYSLETVLMGQIDTIVADLTEHDLEEKLAALADGAP